MQTRNELINLLEGLALEVELAPGDAHAKAQRLALLRGAGELCKQCPALVCSECRDCKWRLKFRNASADQVSKGTYKKAEK